MNADGSVEKVSVLFQSPWSGQICLNPKEFQKEAEKALKFQSPWSGQICLNATLQDVAIFLEVEGVSIPLIGSNLFKYQLK